MQTRHFALVSALILLGLTGCSDPAVGDWESDRNDCGERSDFTVDDDLRVDGSANFGLVGGCNTCKFDGTMEERGDGRYDVEISFDDCRCQSGSRDADGDCSLNSDETRFSCEIDFCGARWEEKFDLLE